MLKRGTKVRHVDGNEGIILRALKGQQGWYTVQVGSTKLDWYDTDFAVTKPEGVAVVRDEDGDIMAVIRCTEKTMDTKVNTWAEQQAREWNANATDREDKPIPAEDHVNGDEFMDMFNAAVDYVDGERVFM